MNSNIYIRVGDKFLELNINNIISIDSLKELYSFDKLDSSNKSNIDIKSTINDKLYIDDESTIDIKSTIDDKVHSSETLDSLKTDKKYSNIKMEVNKLVDANSIASTNFLLEFGKSNKKRLIDEIYDIENNCHKKVKFNISPIDNLNEFLTIMSNKLSLKNITNWRKMYKTHINLFYLLNIEENNKFHKLWASEYEDKLFWYNQITKFREEYPKWNIYKGILPVEILESIILSYDKNIKIFSKIKYNNYIDNNNNVMYNEYGKIKRKEIVDAYLNLY